MKALTICQPYAELIACGEKRVENRTWSTSYRGPLAIHAGTSRTWLRTYSPLPRRMDFGRVVAVCDLVECLSLAVLKHYAQLYSARCAGRTMIKHLEKYGWILSHEHASGPYCWVLENVRRIDPVKASGKQGLWNWEPPK